MGRSGIRALRSTPTLAASPPRNTKAPAANGGQTEGRSIVLQQILPPREPMIPPPPAAVPAPEPRYIVESRDPVTGRLLRGGTYLPYMVFGYGCTVQGITAAEMATAIRVELSPASPAFGTLPVHRWPSLVFATWVAREVSQ